MSDKRIIDDFRDEYRFLSNFYVHPLEYKGLTYHSAEAAFQAQKCATEEEKVKYTLVKNPVVVKAMGKKEPGFPANWDEISYGIMEDILKAKFSVPERKEKLLATGDAELIEGNRWHDNKWGNCTCERCANKEGLNWLGQILTEIRNNLKNEE